jgi:hypothetical protein
MKVFLLTAISAASILIVLSLGYYRKWFIEQPLFYWGAFVRESRCSASLESIRQARYGMPYTISMKVKAAVDKKRMSDAVLLQEPNTYYRDSLHTSLHIPEPAVFYYYTGLRAVWMNSPEVGRANYLVRVEKETVILEPIGSQEQLRMIRARYQQFPPIL